HGSPRCQAALRRADMARGKRGSRRSGHAPTTARSSAVRVKTAGRRKPSSTQWLERQLDDRFHFLKPGARIVDLGCAPGGWTQVATARVRAEAGSGRVVGIDTLAI